MMNELIELMQENEYSLIVLHEGDTFTFEGHGIRKLYNIINEQPEMFLHAKVAAKTVGRTAAKMLVSGGVDEVYAETISDLAYAVLNDAGVKVRYEKKVDHATFLRIWEKLGETL